MFMIILSLALFMALAFAPGILRSLKPNLAAKVGIVPVAQTATTALTTNGVDLVGFDGAMAIINTGAIASSGDFSVKLQESDTNSSDFTDVAAADLDSDITTTASLAANSTYRIGYKGSKRYINVIFVKNSGTSIVAGCVILKGYAHQAPVASTD